MTTRDERVRRVVFAYLKANPNARRDEIVATLEADPSGPVQDAADVNTALKDLEAEGLVFQLSSDPIDGDRFATIAD